MPALSDAVRSLLEDQNFAHVATVNEDGTPRVTPVWIDVEGEEPVFNSAVGRVKVRNLRRDPRIALEITDGTTPTDTC